MSRAITGGCLCRAVRFSATSEPIAVRQCWCRDCQYWAAGSASVNAIFDAQTVTVDGEMTLFVSQADSGNTMRRGFCSTCGTPLTSASDARPNLVILRVGAFDDPGLAKPAMTIWAASAPHWAHLDPNLPAVEGQPPALSASSR